MPFPKITLGAFNVAFGEAGVGAFDHIVEAPIDSVDVKVKVSSV